MTPDDDTMTDEDIEFIIADLRRAASCIAGTIQQLKKKQKAVKLRQKMRDVAES